MKRDKTEEVLVEAARYAEKHPEYLHHHPQGEFQEDCRRCRLNAFAPMLLDIVKLLLEDAELNLEASGGCDLAVGICACGVIGMLDATEGLIKSIEGR